MRLRPDPFVDRRRPGRVPPAKRRRGGGHPLVRYELLDAGGSITGYVYSAYAASNSSVAYLETQRIPGSVDGERVFMQLEQNPQSEYAGSVDGDTMELGSETTSWEGRTAMLEDFGEAAEELAEEAWGQPIQD